MRDLYLNAWIHAADEAHHAALAAAFTRHGVLDAGSPLRLGVSHYTADATIDGADDLAHDLDALAEADPTATLATTLIYKIVQDPHYEIDGVLRMRTPQLGTFDAPISASRSRVRSHEEVMTALNDGPITTAGQRIATLFGQPWDLAIRALKPAPVPNAQTLWRAGADEIGLGWSYQPLTDPERYGLPPAGPEHDGTNSTGAVRAHAVCVKHPTLGWVWAQEEPPF